MDTVRRRQVGWDDYYLFIYLFIFVNSFVNSFLYSFISFLGR